MDDTNIYHEQEQGYVMKKILKLSTVTIMAGLAGGSVVLAEDGRELVELTVPQQTALLSEMRQLFEKVDDTLIALAEGNMKKVKFIADYELGFGHNKLKKMLDSGMPESEVAKVRLKMLEQRKSGKGYGSGNGQGQGKGQGVGRFLPKEMRAIGQGMHKAAAKLSITAGNISSEPSVDDYKALVGNLQELTNSCRACHVAYKIR